MTKDERLFRKKFTRFIGKVDLSPLTPRQYQMVRCIKMGMSIHEIAILCNVPFSDIRNMINDVLARVTLEEPQKYIAVLKNADLSKLSDPQKEAVSSLLDGLSIPDIVKLHNWDRDYTYQLILDSCSIVEKNKNADK